MPLDLLLLFPLLKIILEDNKLIIFYGFYIPLYNICLKIEPIGVL